MWKQAKEKDVKGRCRQLGAEELSYSYSSFNIDNMIKIRMMKEVCVNGKQSWWKSWIFLSKRVVPKVMSNFFLQANWEQQTKESAVVDGTSCCVILECLVTSTACIT